MAASCCRDRVSLVSRWRFCAFTMRTASWPLAPSRYCARYMREMRAQRRILVVVVVVVVVVAALLMLLLLLLLSPPLALSLALRW